MKSAEELAYTRQAAAAASHAMRAGVEASHEGASENDVAAVIYADLVRAGMAFHLVPGFFVLGEYGIVVSEAVVVAERGCEVVTAFPRDVFVV